MGAKLVRFRRARTVVAYWRKDELVFENYLSRVAMSADPRSISMLHFFDTWRTPAECYVPSGFVTVTNASGTTSSSLQFVAD